MIVNEVKLEEDVIEGKFTYKLEALIHKVLGVSEADESFILAT